MLFERLTEVFHFTLRWAASFCLWHSGRLQVLSGPPQSKHYPVVLSHWAASLLSTLPTVSIHSHRRRGQWLAVPMEGVQQHHCSRQLISLFYLFIITYFTDNHLVLFLIVFYTLTFWSSLVRNPFFYFDCFYLLSVCVCLIPLLWYHPNVRSVFYYFF